jgi:hypothetical protein
MRSSKARNRGSESKLPTGWDTVKIGSVGLMLSRLGRAKGGGFVPQNGWFLALPHLPSLGTGRHESLAG